MSDRLELLRPLLTPAIHKMALMRLSDGEPLVKKGDKPTGKRRTEIKLALLLVHILNPFEDFGIEEKALIHGISTDTLARREVKAGTLAKL